jgi:hypothetical protein
MPRMLTCGLCGNAFECEGIPGCWCSEIKLADRRRETISSRASDCVCRSCLVGDPVQ